MELRAEGLEPAFHEGAGMLAPGAALPTMQTPLVEYLPVRSPLDCGSFERALETVAALLDASPAELRSTLAAYDSEAPDTNGELMPLGERILVRCVGLSQPPTPGTIHWFHATRTWPAGAFENGILSRRKVEPELWERLGKLVETWSTREEWEAFRRDMGRNPWADQYRRRRRFQVDDGPYAYLVRDMIFRMEDEPAHFLEAPETISDICLAYQTETGHPLLEKFKEATRPCVVRFRSDRANGSELRAALSYLYCEIRQIGHSHYSNTCFAGMGVPVPAADILDVEWL